MKRIILQTMLLIAVAVTCRAEELPVSHFGTEGLAGWKSKAFKGVTDYTLVKENGRTVVKAHSKTAASGLVKTVKLDPHQFRYLKWSWKVAGIIPNGDEHTKAGDDYAARVYVVFPGRFFWQTRPSTTSGPIALPKGPPCPTPIRGMT